MEGVEGHVKSAASSAVPGPQKPARKVRRLSGRTRDKEYFDLEDVEVAMEQLG